MIWFYLLSCLLTVVTSYGEVQEKGTQGIISQHIRVIRTVIVKVYVTMKYWYRSHYEAKVLFFNMTCFKKPRKFNWRLKHVKRNSQSYSVCPTNARYITKNCTSISYHMVRNVPSIKKIFILYDHVCTLWRIQYLYLYLYLYKFPKMGPTISLRCGCPMRYPLY